MGLCKFPKERSAALFDCDVDDTLGVSTLMPGVPGRGPCLDLPSWLFAEREEPALKPGRMYVGGSGVLCCSASCRCSSSCLPNAELDNAPAPLAGADPGLHPVT